MNTKELEKLCGEATKITDLLEVKFIKAAEMAGATWPDVIKIATVAFIAWKKLDKIKNKAPAWFFYLIEKNQDKVKYIEEVSCEINEMAEAYKEIKYNRLVKLDKVNKMCRKKTRIKDDFISTRWCDPVYKYT